MVSQATKSVTYKKIEISSAVFIEHGFIPRRYTCDGENVNPPLNINKIPKEAKSLAIIMDDPDAAMGTCVHWVMWNIPVVHHLKENDFSGTQGVNDFRMHVYNGPCPPKGTHRYFFKVYALDRQLDLPISSNANDLENAMSDHILGFGELIGLYSQE